jgi:hypothetical protein
VTKPARFTSADLTRALRSVDKAGMRGAVIELTPDGKILILTSAQAAANDVRRNPLDRVLSR